MDPQALYDSLNAGPAPANAPPLDYSSLLGYAPTEPPETLVEPFAPALPTPQSAHPAQPVLPAGASVGAGFSQQGYSPAAYQQLQANNKGLDARASQDDLAAAAPYAPLTQDAHAAGDEARAAALREAEIESHKLIATSEGKQKIAEAQNDFMAKEQAAIDNAKMEADTAHSQYRAALMDYAAAKVNPAQLWDAGGMAGQFAMIATAFGHDFLGAKGIQTSGMDSINKAIQNNINSQLEAMRKKGDVAQGFKQLWDMQRAQSTSDLEARQRMNGFYLSALSNQIEANLGGYDSQLALVKGQAAKAALMQEQVKNDVLVRKQIDESANARASRRIQKYGIDVGAASARYSADAHLKAAMAGRDKTNPLASLIYDTSTSGKNEAKRRFHPEVKPEEQVKIQLEVAKNVKTVENIQKLSDLQDKIDAVPPGNLAIVKKLQSEQARVADQVRDLVKMGIIYDNSGKQINEQEIKIYDRIVGEKDWWLNGDNRRTLGNLADMTMQGVKAKLSAVSDELLPGDPAFGKTSGSTDSFAPAESTRAEVEAGENAGRPGPSPAKEALKAATAPKGHEAAYPVGEVFGKEVPVFDEKDRTKAEVYQDLYTKFLKETPAAAGDSPGRAPKNFIAVETLANLAHDGDNEAKRALSTLATQPLEPGDATGALLQTYAKWEQAQKGL